MKNIESKGWKKYKISKEYGAATKGNIHEMRKLEQKKKREKKIEKHSKNNDRIFLN